MICVNHIFNLFHSPINLQIWVWWVNFYYRVYNPMLLLYWNDSQPYFYAITLTKDPKAIQKNLPIISTVWPLTLKEKTTNDMIMGAVILDIRLCLPMTVCLYCDPPIKWLTQIIFLINTNTHAFISRFYFCCVSIIW